MRILQEILRLVKSQFWPFALFWLAIGLMRFYEIGGLWTLAFVNAEWAVQFWVKRHSYLVSFAACGLAGNLDLAMWFWFFKRGRYVLTAVYPQAGRWLVNKFDVNQYCSSSQDGRLVGAIKWLAGYLVDAFGRTRYWGLFLMGFTPFCGIIVGVPTAVGYNLRYGFWVMALGNLLKVIVFGYIIATKWLLLVVMLIILVFIFLRKEKPAPTKRA